MKKEQGWNLSTDGIDMEAWVPTEDEKGKAANISFNIWDFAGQEGNFLFSIIKLYFFLLIFYFV